MSSRAAVTAPAATAASLGDETRGLMRLALPIALAHLGNQALGTVDTAVVGRLGEVPLGAVGLGNGLYFGVSVLGLGLMLGLDPLMAQALGAGERGRARGLLWQGGFIALGITVPLTLLTLGAVWLLPSLGVAQETAHETAAYVESRVPSLLFFLLLVGGRTYLQAHGITLPMVLGVIVANVINLPMSWLLVFGDEGLVRLGLPALGVPSLGVAGAGWTSSACTVIQCAVVYAAVRIYRDDGPAPRRRPDRALIAKTSRVGIFIALTLLAEVGSFTLTGVLAALLGSRALASHNVALTLASTTFQVPLAIGIAASVRVGHAVGRSDPVATRRAGLVAMGAAALFMVGCGLAFLLAPGPLARVIASDPAVVAAAVPLLLVAAAFQLVDGIQVVGAGALRGAGDTRFALWSNVVGHYALGLPIGALLAFGLGWGAVGLWWGLSIGLTAVALALGLRFVRVSARPVART